MANKVTITDTKNQVTITPQSSTNIDTSTTNTPVTVTQGTTSVVQVNNPGPIGPTGATGPVGAFNTGDDVIGRNITASGDISSSGDIISRNLSTTDITTENITVTGIAAGASGPEGRILLIDGTSSPVGKIASTPNLQFVNNQLITTNITSVGNITATDATFTGNITASGDISASGDIFADTASFFNIILDHRDTAEPTINFKSDGGPNFTLGFSGDNVFQLSGETGATGQVFELASEVETFRMKSGGTALIQRGSGTGTSGTGSKHDGGLFIEAQNTDSSNGKAAQFTALSTGGILKNTSYGGTGKHGTFKFINGGNLNNDVDATEHVVAIRAISILGFNK
mgnify:CR=1 FL=1